MLYTQEEQETITVALSYYEESFKMESMKKDFISEVRSLRGISNTVDNAPVNNDTRVDMIVIMESIKNKVSTQLNLSLDERFVLQVALEHLNEAIEDSKKALTNQLTDMIQSVEESFNNSQPKLSLVADKGKILPEKQKVTMESEITLSNPYTVYIESVLRKINFENDVALRTANNIEDTVNNHIDNEHVGNVVSLRNKYTTQKTHKLDK